ncbi:MAG: hypothetical protein Sv326_1326 (plasmid) [Candidatus Fermentimicrarchaeum limneticum]|uniref:Uncharacterized protein n=1 Tax=Fermentimicrarchaeum limneticum TaxID=2795018 RepID=A0A7D6BTK8_FERL1|nr:MAG: hypothetical protein Sv326_1326 [Candidatus Fermentimicrarchaeum limneticum]
MPKRTDEKPPERPPRAENIYEQINVIANPQVNDTEVYEDPITRNQTLSNFDESGANFQREGHLLFCLCTSQGKLLEESARAINALMQGDANIRRGIGGKTQDAITTYTYRQTIKKETRGESKGNIPLGRKEED